MFNLIPTVIKKLWEKWNLRFFILFSLSLQTILILCAPFRKRTPNIWIIFIVWTSYLLADWAANFAIGLISNRQGNNPDSDYARDLLALWAPFLLLHLGGPDTITAFALEDNTLWKRHLLGLIFQVIATLYVFSESFPKNKLWLPTCLLFLAGIIKYAERTLGLYGASLDNFKEAMIKTPDPGPNYAKLMEEYSSKKEAELPTHIELTAERSKEFRTKTYMIEANELESDIAVVRHAHHFFQIFKGLIVDLIFSFQERQESRDFFHDRKPEEAFKLIVVELNFLYEALFTKAAVVHSTRGYIFRAISISAIFVALVFFYKLEKEGLHSFDVGVTYTLLFGAIGLDLIAVFMLIFSDWTVAAINKSWLKFFKASNIFEKYLNLKRSSLSTEKTNGGQENSSKITKCLMWTKKILFWRWYGSVSMFNLIDFSRKEREKVSPTIFDGCGSFYIKFLEYFGLKDRRDKIKYRSSKPLTAELWKFIFDELRGSARGDWVLEDRVVQDSNLVVQDGDKDKHNKVISKLLSYVVDVEYDQSILLWHIATDLCYEKSNDVGDGSHRGFSKTLSDYMLYLLVMQPTMMSSVAGIGQTRFRDTCAEAKKFFSRSELESGVEEKVHFCEGLLDINTDVQPIDVKGDRSKSVLFDACILAKELAKMEENKWELISKVWVELLSYSASHCRANNHAQLLGKGGELVTFVWLLMAHFGIGEQFQINEGHARAKLIVKK
ncbi:uncharacterized protein Pyn_17513 [Prunus yedoensis var. nudiflora]|uniref:DUF4220 domain-containing protein n=1 Tax=Prunus yedoensis var. nudiflora TaxID=2094558 RepID=A0A314XGR9_PRUYE|nr:uncharacterized protein Pyn_17513 [Prunus yedoensis var. nudiflora]